MPVVVAVFSALFCVWTTAAQMSIQYRLTPVPRAGVQVCLCNASDISLHNPFLSPNKTPNILGSQCTGRDMLGLTRRSALGRVGCRV